MKCKKCKKTIPDGSMFCNLCGAKQKDNTQKRSDGRYVKSITIDGKRKYFYGKTKKEINQKIINYNQEQEEKLISPPFYKVADEWAETKKNEVEYTTWNGYRKRYLRIKEYFNDTPISDIRLKDINSYIALFPTSWAKKTATDYKSVANLIFSYAVRNEYIESNPMQYSVTPKNTTKTERRSVTSAERKIIDNTWNTADYGLMYYFFLYSGLRKGEALALTWGDIDFINKEIKVNKSVAYKKNFPYLKKPKSKKGIRNVILLDCLAEKLKPLKQKKSKLVFPNDDGEYMKRSDYEYAYKYWKKSTELDGVTAHILRHSFATYLFEAGLQVKDVQELMGHAQYSTTMDIYTHFTQQRKTEALRLANDFSVNQLNK